MKYEINTKNILKELEQLKKTKEEYENAINSFYTTLSECSAFWKDNIAMSFYLKVDTEKIVIQKNLISMNDKYNVLEYIYNQYKEIGDNIKVNMSSKDTVIQKINQIINRCANLLNRYYYLSTYFAPYEAYYLRLEKNKIQNIYNEVKTIKNNILNQYQKISEIELTVQTKLSNIEYTKIEDFEEYEYTK